VAQHRRKFSPQLEAGAVELVSEKGCSIAEITRELEINEGTLGNWVHERKKSNPEPENPETGRACRRGRDGRREPQTATGQRGPKRQRPVRVIVVRQIAAAFANHRCAVHTGYFLTAKRLGLQSRQWQRLAFNW
jgi:transposase-like protein